ncbi:MAG: F0F1 ATP synthase subunit epsilon [Pseudomonadota bacterium]
MADKVTFELVSPERLLKSVEAEMVVVPGAEGDFGVLAGHAPVMSIVRPGVVEIYAAQGGAPERLFVGGGFAEVADDRLTLLAEDAADLAQVKPEEASRALAHAREDLGDAKTAHERAALAEKVKRLEALNAALKP